MRVESYFDRVRKAVELSPIVRLSNVTYEKRGSYEGVIRGRVSFVDNTILEWREYVDVEMKVDRLMYVYQYMDSSHNLIFRYDNTGHHKKLGLPTYPDHKHMGMADRVLPSDPTDLQSVLLEIESMVRLT